MILAFYAPILVQIPGNSIIPLYHIQGNFEYGGILLYKQHIMQCTSFQNMFGCLWSKKVLLHVNLWSSSSCRNIHVHTMQQTHHLLRKKNCSTYRSHLYTYTIFHLCTNFVMQNSASSIHWLSSSIFDVRCRSFIRSFVHSFVRSFVRPAWVTSPLISTIYTNHIFSVRIWSVSSYPLWTSTWQKLDFSPTPITVGLSIKSPIMIYKVTHRTVENNLYWIYVMAIYG